jgi:hypothetical protein
MAEGAAKSISKKIGKNTPEAIAIIKADILKDRRSQIVPAPSIS